MTRLDLCSNASCGHLESAHLSSIRSDADPATGRETRNRVRSCAVAECACSNYQEPKAPDERE